MPNSSINQILSGAISWKKHTTDPGLRSFLGELQANILKGHGREHTANIFLNFDGASKAKLRATVKRLTKGLTPALKQLKDAEKRSASRKARKATPFDGGRVTCFMLSNSGYQALGESAARTPADAAFRAGHKPRSLALFDTPKHAWDTHLGGPDDADKETRVDALLLVADSSAQKVQNFVNKIDALLASQPVTILGVERGAGRKMKVGGKFEGIENFGYVDGRSQPLFLEEDASVEPKSNWDARFVSGQFITPDPAGATPHSAGSYFVFRKLEQNVRGFKHRETALAAALGLTGGDAERAGALAVGRFQDGTPVVLNKDAKNINPVANDFNFAGDPNGQKCPFRGHIRKTNPRGESVRLGASVQQERAHIMARRGITYGARVQDPDGVFLDRPAGGVGLLFMAYMSDIANQFEFTQMSWANEPRFVSGFKPGDALTGIDPAIGQRPAGAPAPMSWHDGWSGKNTPDLDFAGFVSMRGGEYFFAPSLSYLTSL